MKDKVLMLFGKLLGLLGFAAVGTSCDGLMSLEYGTPYTSFEVTGKLIDKETKEPVSGIVIVYGEEHSDWDAAGNETRRFYQIGNAVPPLLAYKIAQQVQLTYHMEQKDPQEIINNIIPQDLFSYAD